MYYYMETVPEIIEKKKEIHHTSLTPRFSLSQEDSNGHRRTVGFGFLRKKEHSNYICFRVF